MKSPPLRRRNPLLRRHRLVPGFGVGIEPCWPGVCGYEQQTPVTPDHKTPFAFTGTILGAVVDVGVDAGHTPKQEPRDRRPPVAPDPCQTKAGEPRPLLALRLPACQRLVEALLGADIDQRTRRSSSFRARSRSPSRRASRPASCACAARSTSNL